MTETEWLTCDDPKPMVEFLWRECSHRKMRLFAVACCRRIQHHMTDHRSRAAVDVAEKYVEGFASHDELASASADAQAVPEWSLIDGPVSDFLARHPATAVTTLASALAAEAASKASFTDHPVAPLVLGLCAVTVADVAFAEHGFSDAARVDERAILCALLRDIFGNPFHPETPDPSVFTLAVKAAAQTNYDEQAFDRLPELADALAEAGCTNANVLEHCRGTGFHVRGCWAVDLILGKE